MATRAGIGNDAFTNQILFNWWQRDARIFDWTLSDNEPPNIIVKRFSYVCKDTYGEETLNTLQ